MSGVRLSPPSPLGRVWVRNPPQAFERATSTGKRSYRRLWKCAECRKPFSILVGTIFERSQVPLSKWLIALYMMSASKNGVAAYEIHRTLGVTNKTAWFMMHRICEAMKRGGPVETMQGVIIADETFIGGDEIDRHAKDRKGIGGGPHHKTAVLSLIEIHSGEVRSRVVPDVTGATLYKAIQEQVDAPAVYSTRTTTPPMGRSASGSLSMRRCDTRSVNTSVATVPRLTMLRGTSRSSSGALTAHTTRKITDSERLALLVSRTAGRRLTPLG
jgi:transposase-like protein